MSRFPSVADCPSGEPMFNSAVLGLLDLVVDSAAPLAGLAVSSVALVLPLLEAGDGSSPDSVGTAGFFDERLLLLLSEGDATGASTAEASVGTKRLSDEMAGAVSITIPFPSSGMRRVTVRGTSRISVTSTVRATRCGTWIF